MKRPSKQRRDTGQTACCRSHCSRRVSTGSSLANEPFTVSLGSSIGRYKIIGTLGTGGMGKVYLAEDTRLGRKIALKLLPEEFVKDKNRLWRFEREARTASALSHPNVCTIHEVGETEDGHHYIAMEYIEGRSLDHRISGRPLDIAEVLRIGSQVADTLDAAHAKGITHRDIKPSNIMITSRSQVKVLDFGLAKLSPTRLSEMASAEPKTTTGLVMGTVPYMSPEQALGREVDHRSDIWSLGVVLYEMATGRLPFSGASASETIDHIVHSQPQAVARFNYDVPPELERIIRKCLEKEKGRRYQAARELQVDLENLGRDRASGVEPTGQGFGIRIGRAAVATIVLDGCIANWSGNLLRKQRWGCSNKRDQFGRGVTTSERKC
jgi:serine/threonine protein kinase